MFETLEDRFENSKPPLDRGDPILMYSLYVVVGLFYLIEGVRRHHPFGAVVGVVVFILSLIWMITTVRSPVPATRRDLWVRGQIVIWILMAYEIAYTVAPRLT
jgi:uncharacterized membrane protein